MFLFIIDVYVFQAMKQKKYVRDANTFSEDSTYKFGADNN